MYGAGCIPWLRLPVCALPFVWALLVGLVCMLVPGAWWWLWLAAGEAAEAPWPWVPGWAWAEWPELWG